MIRCCVWRLCVLSPTPLSHYVPASVSVGELRFSECTSAWVCGFFFPSFRLISNFIYCTASRLNSEEGRSHFLLVSSGYLLLWQLRMLMNLFVCWESVKPYFTGGKFKLEQLKQIPGFLAEFVRSRIDAWELEFGVAHFVAFCRFKSCFLWSPVAATSAQSFCKSSQNYWWGEKHCPPSSGFLDTREMATGWHLSRSCGWLLSLQDFCLDGFLLCPFCL